VQRENHGERETCHSLKRERERDRIRKDSRIIYVKRKSRGEVEAARTSETSVDIQLRTRQYIPEDFELHTGRCENLKSHNETMSCRSQFNEVSARVIY
jgi:hypothetical protein